MVYQIEIRMPDGSIQTVQFLAASEAAAELEVERFLEEQEKKDAAA